jgi:hypothetical protein
MGISGRRTLPLFLPVHAGRGERVGGEHLVERSRTQDAALQHDFAYAFPALGRLLGDLGRRRVTDARSEHGGKPDGLVQIAAAARLAGADPRHAAARELVQAVLQNLQREERVIGDDRHHDVQFQLPRLGRHGDGRLGPDHLEADHVGDFGHDRIHLPRHDGGAGLHGGKGYLAQAGTRARGKQPQVVGDPDQVERRPFEARAERHEGVHVLHPFHQVGAADKILARFTGKPRDDPVDEGLLRIEPGPHRGPADAEFAQARQRAVKSRQVVADGLCVGGELLPQTDRDRVLQVGAAGFQDAVELDRLAAQGTHQPPQFGPDLIGQFQSREPHGGREHVVGGLGHVDVVVRVHLAVDAERAAHQFVGAVCQHLVHIHIVGSSGAGLKGVDQKLVLEVAGKRLVRGSDDRPAELGVEPSGRHVGQGRAFFDPERGADEGGVRLQS